MNNLQKYAIDVTKDIVIAKLSNSSPGSSNGNVGIAISEMFEEIYNKIYDICSKDESK